MALFPGVRRALGVGPGRSVCWLSLAGPTGQLPAWAWLAWLGWLWLGFGWLFLGFGMIWLDLAWIWLDFGWAWLGLDLASIWLRFCTFACFYYA